MAERRPIIRRCEGVPLRNKMDQEIASAINSTQFHQMAPALIQTMNVNRDTKCTIMAITHHNSTAAMVVA
jgi:hypothetical protein